MKEEYEKSLKESEKRLEKFDETLFSTSDETINTFPNAVLYAVRFEVTQKIDVCNDDEFKEANENIFEKLIEINLS